MMRRYLQLFECQFGSEEGEMEKFYFEAVGISKAKNAVISAKVICTNVSLPTFHRLFERCELRFGCFRQSSSSAKK